MKMVQWQVKVGECVKFVVLRTREAWNVWRLCQCLDHKVVVVVMVVVVVVVVVVMMMGVDILRLYFALK
ncbi:hypothetical protein E2C01_089571 [Portunus trituberculatus]|uniref:Transmembrane protein n=1 Tax=Portunus trituberculatus TaxID=210409 RepID=A0A5B7JJ58_PORTR|nr:hypothetical protein [Portunus trituberculatus]